MAITTLTNAAADIGTLERGGWAALQRLDASALCASALVAQEEAPCYCGDAADDCVCSMAWRLVTYLTG